MLPPQNSTGYELATLLQSEPPRTRGGQMKYFTVQYDTKDRMFKLVHGSLSEHSEGDALEGSEISIEDADKSENSSIRYFLARWPMLLSNN
jgi:hypothetical protein